MPVGDRVLSLAAQRTTEVNDVLYIGVVRNTIQVCTGEGKHFFREKTSVGKFLSQI